jgi:hypothetical protein
MTSSGRNSGGRWLKHSRQIVRSTNAPLETAADKGYHSGDALKKPHEQE